MQYLIITSFFLSLFLSRRPTRQYCICECLLSMSLLLCDEDVRDGRSDHPPVVASSWKGLVVIAIDIIVVVINAAIIEEHLLFLEGRWSAHTVTTSTADVIHYTSSNDLVLLCCEAIMTVSSRLLLCWLLVLSGGLLCCCATFRGHSDTCRLSLVLLFLAYHVHFNVQTVVFFVASAAITAIRATWHEISPRGVVTDKVLVRGADKDLVMLGIASQGCCELLLLWMTVWVHVAWGWVMLLLMIYLSL